LLETKPAKSPKEAEPASDLSLRMRAAGVAEVLAALPLEMRAQLREHLLAELDRTEMRQGRTKAEVVTFNKAKAKFAKRTAKKAAA
jgi:hypothetical protein